MVARQDLEIGLVRGEFELSRCGFSGVHLKFDPLFGCCAVIGCNGSNIQGSVGSVDFMVRLGFFTSAMLHCARCYGLNTRT